MPDMGLDYHLDDLEAQLSEARTFLASIGTAQSQGTQEQTDWMVQQAREGLRRAGGVDLDRSVA